MGQPKTKMTKSDAARIEKAGAKKTGGQTPPGSFASRAKRAAEKNTQPKP